MVNLAIEAEWPDLAGAPQATALPAESIPPAATSPAISTDLEIPAHLSYINSVGYYTIVGEVRNNSLQPYRFVKITAAPLGVATLLADSVSTHTEFRVLPPGGKCPFLIQAEKWGDATQYELVVEGRPGGDLPGQDLVLKSHTYTIDGDTDYFKIQGEIENRGTTTARSVIVAITLYDSAGSVVGVANSSTAPLSIPGGGTASFLGVTDHWTGFDHYEIQAQGQ